MKWLKLALALAFVAAHLAPAIHASVPHEEELAHCTHQNAGTHVERHDFHHDDAPCFICLFAAGGSDLRGIAASPVVIVDSEGFVLPAETRRVDLVLTLPDSRGPPRPA